MVPQLRAIVFFFCVLGLAACDRYPGFEKTENDYYRKLNAFGDCGPAIGSADNTIIRWMVRPAEGQDYVFSQDSYYGTWKMVSNDSTRWLDEIGSLRCGDDVSLILPVSSIVSAGLIELPDSVVKSAGELELRIYVVRTFEQASFVEYLMNAAQQEELSEEMAIELSTLNSGRPLEKHGRVYIERLNEVSMASDSVRPGREIEITYRTRLLNQVALDSLTTMQFPFGRPGQLIPGLQYAVSLLREGEQARVFIPSDLAFGEEGSSTGIAPKRTPLVFEVSVNRVD